jgi:hypothetical protein
MPEPPKSHTILRNSADVLHGPNIYLWAPTLYFYEIKKIICDFYSNISRQNKTILSVF